LFSFFPISTQNGFKYKPSSAIKLTFLGSPTHSLLNYAHWRIVSPESSLARLEGCDGYIAQVWTGTVREPNHFRGRGTKPDF
jgi:hypothetical protein